MFERLRIVYRGPVRLKFKQISKNEIRVQLARWAKSDRNWFTPKTRGQSLFVTKEKFHILLLFHFNCVKEKGRHVSDSIGGGSRGRDFHAQVEREGGIDSHVLAAQTALNSHTELIIAIYRDSTAKTRTKRQPPTFYNAVINFCTFLGINSIFIKLGCVNIRR